MSKAYKSFAMEGFIARMYARNTGLDLRPFNELAERISHMQPAGARILEVAPGPGYLAVELARVGQQYDVTGLDISETFVDIAREHAATAGVKADFRVGNVSAMPFTDDSFDFIVCRAAFKNFAQPDSALREMHRVLKPNGRALIIDMRRDATNADIDKEVSGMGLSFFSRLMTGWIMKYSLRPRAYPVEDFRRMATTNAPFKECAIVQSPIGFEAILTKQQRPQDAKE